MCIVAMVKDGAFLLLREVFSQAESPGILADHRDILPSEAVKALASYFAKRGREIDKVNIREEIWHVQICLHCLDVVSSATSDLFLFQ